MQGHNDRKRAASILLTLCVAGSALLLPACESGGNFRLLGYSTTPNYDCNIRTVYVPIFQNKTFRRGLEFDLTRAVVREIEAKTPYKVVSSCEGADTELTGTIISVTKQVVNINPSNEVREAETALNVEVVWRDLRSGQILSKPTRLMGDVGVNPGLTPNFTLPDAPEPKPANDPPVLVQSVDRFIPELGQSITTAFKGNVDRLAIQIVSMMETPW